MAVVTKHKIYASGKMESGHFNESDSNTVVKLKADSNALVNELIEDDAPVRFTKEGNIIAAEFREV